MILRAPRRPPLELWTISLTTPGVTSTDGLLLGRCLRIRPGTPAPTAWRIDMVLIISIEGSPEDLDKVRTNAVGAVEMTVEDMNDDGQVDLLEVSWEIDE
jgi:hypothetical protein